MLIFSLWDKKRLLLLVLPQYTNKSLPPASVGLFEMPTADTLLSLRGWLTTVTPTEINRFVYP